MADWQLTPRAEQDLADIWLYTRQRWSPAQADRYVSALFDAMDALAAAPARGRSAETIRPGYRRQASGRHVIFYRPGGSGIEIIRILHQRMDMPGQMEGEQDR